MKAEHKTKDGVIVMVEVEQTLIDDIQNQLADPDGISPMTLIGLVFTDDNPITDAGSEYLGTISDISEQEASEIVERVKAQRANADSGEMVIELQEVGYADYVNEGVYCLTALESLRSLIQSKGLCPEKTILIKRKEK